VSAIPCPRRHAALLIACASIPLLLVGCASSEPPPQGTIIVAGEAFTTQAPIVTWVDPGGYDGQRETCWFRDNVLPTRPAQGCNEPRRYGSRRTRDLDPALAAAVERDGWTLPNVLERVDQVVVHFDVCGCSKRCFEVLHDIRGLSCHFLLDVDGTVYQTLDLAHRGRHATIANDRSIGIEIAHIGAYPDLDVLRRWYQGDDTGRLTIVFPESIGDPKIRTPGFVAHPARDELIHGPINDQDLYQYDFTAEQYASLTTLLRALSDIFPRIPLDAPRDDKGQVIPRTLSREAFDAFSGVLGHYHIQTNKNDPGPAFDWDRVLRPRDSAP
jgi:N-acetyl-anhydromuramyl-L-alanine amidase AmpD